MAHGTSPSRSGHGYPAGNNPDASGQEVRRLSAWTRLPRGARFTSPERPNQGRRRDAVPPLSLRQPPVQTQSSHSQSSSRPAWSAALATADSRSGGRDGRDARDGRDGRGDVTDNGHAADLGHTTGSPHRLRPPGNRLGPPHA